MKNDKRKLWQITSQMLYRFEIYFFFIIYLLCLCVSLCMYAYEKLFISSQNFSHIKFQNKKSLLFSHEAINYLLTLHSTLKIIKLIVSFVWYILFHNLHRIFIAYIHTFVFFLMLLQRFSPFSQIITGME